MTLSKTKQAERAKRVAAKKEAMAAKKEAKKAAVKKASAKKASAKKASAKKASAKKAGTNSKPRVRKPVTERSKKAQPITGLDGPVIRNGALHFSPKDLLLFRLSEAELANAHQSVSIKRSEQAQAKSAYQMRAAQMEQDLRALLQNGQEKHDEHHALKEKIAAVYDIDFAHITYDDQSGRIYVHDKPVSMPVAPGK